MGVAIETPVWVPPAGLNAAWFVRRANFEPRWRQRAGASSYVSRTMEQNSTYMLAYFQNNKLDVGPFRAATGCSLWKEMNSLRESDFVVGTLCLHSNSCQAV